MKRFVVLAILIMAVILAGCADRFNSVLAKGGQDARDTAQVIVGPNNENFECAAGELYARDKIGILDAKTKAIAQLIYGRSSSVEIKPSWDGSIKVDKATTASKDFMTCHDACLMTLSGISEIPAIKTIKEAGQIIGIGLGK
jgi:hypothetical protein